MRVNNVSPAAALEYSHGRRHDDADQDVLQYRYRFSPVGVILDLSREAMEQTGLDQPSDARQTPPLLFIYNEGGAFAYDEPDYPVPDRLAIEEEVIETPMPSVVTFDGMLGGA